MQSINKEEALLFFLIEMLAGRIWFRCLNEVVRYMRLARGVRFFFKAFLDDGYFLVLSHYLLFLVFSYLKMVGMFFVG